VALKGSVPQLKGSFGSKQEYFDTFAPLVMEEIRAELLQEREEREEVRLKLLVYAALSY
jgi:hypothetical protein